MREILEKLVEREVIREPREGKLTAKMEPDPRRSVIGHWVQLRVCVLVPPFSIRVNSVCCTLLPGTTKQVR